MSNEALTWAFRQDLPMTEKFVLVSLADYADDENSCYPSYAKTARRVGCSRRTVMRAVEALTDAGFVRSEPRDRANGSASSNRYVLNVDAPQGGGDRESLPPVTESHHPSDTQTLGVVTQGHWGSDTSVTPITINEPSSITHPEPKTHNTGAGYTDDFLEWWSHYPLKKGKGSAFKEWKRIKGVPLAVLIEGADRYDRDPNRRPQYTKYPQGWLSARMWEDEDGVPAQEAQHWRQDNNERMAAARRQASRGQQALAALSFGEKEAIE